jgi:hypothetical protein
VGYVGVGLFHEAFKHKESYVGSMEKRNFVRDSIVGCEFIAGCLRLTFILLPNLNLGITIEFHK